MPSMDHMLAKIRTSLTGQLASCALCLCRSVLQSPIVGQVRSPPGGWADAGLVRWARTAAQQPTTSHATLAQAGSQQQQQAAGLFMTAEVKLG